MQKEVDKKEVKPVEETSSLSPQILKAIQDSVKAMAQEIVTQLKPVTPNVPPTKIIPTAANANPAANYQRKLKGIQVEEGQDLRHVNPEVIKKWFMDRENHWKDNYNKKQVGGTPVSMNWTRG